MAHAFDLGVSICNLTFPSHLEVLPARAGDDGANASSSWLGDAPAVGQAGMAEQGWETVSELVLGRHLLLWDDILEPPFLQVGTDYEFLQYCCMHSSGTSKSHGGLLALQEAHALQYKF